jgi:hypothetical protein
MNPELFDFVSGGMQGLAESETVGRRPMKAATSSSELAEAGKVLLALPQAVFLSDQAL